MDKYLLFFVFFVCALFFFTEKTSAQIICTERLPTTKVSEVKSKMAGIKTKFWKPGQTITIKFLSGETVVRNKVKQYAQEWLKYANLRFDFVPDNANAMIRIDFQKGGSYSYVGTDNLQIPQKDHTMNFGWLTPDSGDQEYSRVVIHEFGHMLGLIHEHSHPESRIPWDKEKVYAYYAKQNWGKEQVNNNIFYRYDHETTQYSQYDKLSIMHYAVPASLTVGGYEVKWNTVLSETDKDFIGKIYPKGNTNPNPNPNPNPSTLILPSSLAVGWYGIPFSKIDAAIHYPNNMTYLFSGKKYIRWDYNDEAYLLKKNIAENWEGVNFDKIDDAFYWEANKKVYFFSGDEYIRYDIAKEKADAGYPMKIKDGWNGLSIFPRIDAILPWKDKVYFFYNNQYVRYDFKSDKIDAGYPKTISEKTWKGISFTKIDAVAVWQYPIVYFFQGSQYHRFNMEKDEAY